LKDVKSRRIKMRKIIISLGIIGLVFVCSPIYAAVDDAVDIANLGVHAINMSSPQPYADVPISITRNVVGTADDIVGLTISLIYDSRYVDVDSIQMGNLIPIEADPFTYWNRCPEVVPDFTDGEVIYNVEAIPDSTEKQLKLIVFDTSAVIGAETGNPLGTADGSLAIVRFNGIAVGGSPLTLAEESVGLADLYETTPGSGEYEVDLNAFPAEGMGVVLGAITVTGAPTQHDIIVNFDAAKGSVSAIIDAGSPVSMSPGVALPVDDGANLELKMQPADHYLLEDILEGGISLMPSVTIDSATGEGSYSLSPVNAAHTYDLSYIIFVGDANGDHHLDWTDAIRVLEHDSNIDPLTGDALQAADINGGGVDWSDALAILEIDGGH